MLWDERSERQALLEFFDVLPSNLKHDKLSFGTFIAANVSPDLRVRDAIGLCSEVAPGDIRSDITEERCSISWFPAISPTVLSAICRTSVSFSLNPAKAMMLCVRFAFSLVPGVAQDLRTFPVDLMLLWGIEPDTDLRAL
jgi:hypothetical protein